MKMSPMVGWLILYQNLMNDMSSPQDQQGSSKPREVPMSELKAEYELIQQKKSKLSAAKRRQIVEEYERRLSEEGEKE